MQQLQTWNPVAWYKMTTQNLSAGRAYAGNSAAPQQERKRRDSEHQLRFRRLLSQRRAVPSQRQFQAGRHKLDDGRGQSRRLPGVPHSRTLPMPRRHRFLSKGSGRSPADDEGAVSRRRRPNCRSAARRLVYFWKAISGSQQPRYRPPRMALQPSLFPADADQCPGESGRTFVLPAFPPPSA